MRGTRFRNVENDIHAIFKLTDGQIVVGTVVDEQHPELARRGVQKLGSRSEIGVST
jgi:hypothetical protein